MTTPKGITYIVVGTLAVLSAVFICTLAYCAVMKIELVGDTFKMAGSSALTALTALLVNTRSQTPDAGLNANSNVHPANNTAALTTSGPVTISNAEPQSESHSASDA